MFGKKNTLSLYPVLLLALCCGCSNDSASTKITTGAEADSAKNRLTAPPSDIKAGMDTVQGKPGAQISLANNQVYQLEPGVEAEITLGLLAPYLHGEMSVSVKTSDGLMILAGATDYLYTLGAGEMYTIPLRLFAPNAGRYYVNLQVTVTHDASETFKSISAIVQAGSEGDRAHPSVQHEKAANSDGVISLPAQEIIIRE